MGSYRDEEEMQQCRINEEISWSSYQKIKDVVIQRKCLEFAYYQCLLKVVVAIFSDWEEFRKRKKRRHAMLKLLCFLREGSTDLEGGFR